MSSSEQPNTPATNVQASTSPDPSHDNQLVPAMTPRPVAHSMSSPTSDSTVRMSRASSNDSSHHGSISVVPEGREDRNSGLAMDTPLPPVPLPSLQQQHAQIGATHIQSPTSLMVAQTMSESPSSIASSVPTRSVPSQVAPRSPQRPPSPPLPPTPTPTPGTTLQRPQTAVSRSSTGVSVVPGRSLSFADAPPPSRHGSTSARTTNNNSNNNSEYTGQVYNRPGSGNLTTNPNPNPTVSQNNPSYRNCDRRTMSSLTSSMEKAGLFLEQDPARVFHVDLGYGSGQQQQQPGVPAGVVDPRDLRYRDSGVTMPIPGSLMTDTLGSSRQMMMMGAGGGGGGDGNGNGRPFIRTNGSDSIGVPLIPRTVQERLQPTINHATEEELKYSRKAKISGYALNIAIGLQVFLSALITALSAVTSGRNTQIMTSVLGGAGTIVASYLARARGSNEPELSIARTKDLQRFIRQCDAFVQDHGLETGFEDSEGKQGSGGGGGGGGGARDLLRAKELDDRINELRLELEHLLGNGDGERRLSPPV